MAVLGQTVVDSLGLMPGAALQQTIRIQGEPFTVVGTLEYKGVNSFRDMDDQIFIPLTTMANRIVGVNAVTGIALDSISASARAAGQMDAAQYQITNLLRLPHKIVPPRQDDFLIRNQADLLSASNSVAGIFTALLGGSAAISLVVGGIGIMNIMLVSVTERTREIGIRRAIGARSSDILLQFMIEAIVLSLCGGLLGVGLGIVASLLINLALGWKAGLALDALLASLLFCLVIGVFFGAYPARKAALLDPITALRNDKPMLRLEKIGKTYRMVDLVIPVLRGIDLTILQGDYIAIMGASGSGKSTLMNVLGCLEQPSEGHYYFDACDITKIADDERTDLRNYRIGFVFQQFNLLPRLTALQNVMLPMVYAGYARGERRQRAQRMLVDVGLADRMANLPSQLSGGQQQRVAIARALVNQPDLLLADEPTGALDSRTGAEVMDLVSSLHQLGITIVLVTHDSSVAARTQRIIRLQDGRIIADG